jgi:hypothetical protein
MRHSKRRDAGCSIHALEPRLLLYSGNVLASISVDGTNSAVREFTQDGVNVKSVDGGGGEIQVDPKGDIQEYGAPNLYRHDGPVTGNGSWVLEKTVPGWSTIGRTFYGGLAVLNQYVFVTDQNTGGGAENGLIRFDANNNYASTRFNQGEDFSDCSIGMDGKLYAIEGGQAAGHVVRVFDPFTLKLIKSVPVPGFDDTCVSADSFGNIYVGEFRGNLYKLKPDGTLITSANLGPQDIDIAADNTLLVPDGYNVRICDTNLNVLKVFPAASYTGANFVCWAAYQQPPSLANPGSIAGTVFNDANGNGVKDSGESGVSAITIYNDANNNSVLDSGELKTTTDGSGNYKLSNLAAGSYKIREILQSGSIQTTPANNYGHTITLASGQNVTGADFGAKQSSGNTASISGTVFNDLNGNGTKDSGEGGLASRTIYIDLDNDSIFDANEKSTTTDSLGNYIFSNLAAGPYKVREVVPQGWMQIAPANNYGWTITLATSQHPTGKNFAVRASSTGGKISGTIFNDLDGDGVKDSGEIGVGSGWKVYIDLDNDSIWDANEVFALTDASGNWTLSNLAAGTYKVRQVLQTGWKQTTPTNNYGLNVTLSTNQSATGKRFGSKQIA